MKDKIEDIIEAFCDSAIEDAEDQVILSDVSSFVNECFSNQTWEHRKECLMLFNAAVVHNPSHLVLELDLLKLLIGYL